ncbi:MAG: hypothetical protein ACR2PB_06725 [Desulfocapsaceae bacterium]
MNIFYKISIDRVNANYISGWCFHRFQPKRTVDLQCFQDGVLLGEAEASMFREDLRALAIHPTGKCGFEFIPDNPDGFDYSKPISIILKEKGTKLADISDEGAVSDSNDIFQPLKRIINKRKKLQQTAVFMHVPKTAGTSFNTLVQSLYPKGTTINHIELLPESRYRSLANDHNYISGHLRFGQLKQHFSSDNIAFYTILREPYAQLQSHLKWLIQTATNPQEKYFKTTNRVIYNLGLKLEQVAFDDIDSLSNLVSSLSPVEAAFIDNVQTRYFLDQQPIRIESQDIDTAIANCHSFVLIGLTERYDRFVNTFKKLNGLKSLPHSPPMNISTSASLFDISNDEVRKVLQPLVQADLILYDFVADKNL